MVSFLVNSCCEVLICALRPTYPTDGRGMVCAGRSTYALSDVPTLYRDKYALVKGACPFGPAPFLHLRGCQAAGEDCEWWGTYSS